MYTRDSEEARNAPLIRGFMVQVVQFSDNGVLEFEVLKSRPFMKFWENCIITRYEPDIDDYRFIFYGSEIVRGYRGDLTGKLLSKTDLFKDEPLMREVNHDCITTLEHDFSSGRVDAEIISYKVWHHAKIPLRRNGTITETLTCISYDKND